MLVDNAADAVAVARENAKAAGLAENVRVKKAPVARYVEREAGKDGPFDLVFVDPPYDEPIEGVLQQLGPHLDVDGRLVLERRWRDEPAPRGGGLVVEADRRYGDTRVLVYRQGTAAGMSKAVCPGSFDPITNGHLVVIERASKIFDELVVAVSGSPSNVSKRGLFTLEERIDLITEVTPHLKNITAVVAFEGLLVEPLPRPGRRLRRQGHPRGERLRLRDADGADERAHGDRNGVPADRPEFSYLSSSLMKEVVTLGGDINGLVPPVVEVRLKEKLGT